MANQERSGRLFLPLGMYFDQRLSYASSTTWGFLKMPDLAHAFPQYLARGLRLGRVGEVSPEVTIPGIWRAS